MFAKRSPRARTHTYTHTYTHLQSLAGQFCVCISVYECVWGGGARCAINGVLLHACVRVCMCGLQLAMMCVCVCVCILTYTVYSLVGQSVVCEYKCAVGGRGSLAHIGSVVYRAGVWGGLVVQWSMREYVSVLRAGIVAL